MQSANEGFHRTGGGNDVLLLDDIHPSVTIGRLGTRSRVYFTYAEILKEKEEEEEEDVPPSSGTEEESHVLNGDTASRYIQRRRGGLHTRPCS